MVELEKNYETLLAEFKYIVTVPAELSFANISNTHAEILSQAQWLLENRFDYLPERTNDFTINYRFSNEQEAILFKLKFG